MNHTVITFGREYGSGGRLIAQKVAEAMSVPFYDRKLIKMAAVESGLSEQFIRDAEQKKTTSFLYNLYFSSQNLPIQDQAFIAESDVIRRIAEEGPCVIVGRCADYILRGRPGCLHIFVHAPLEERLRRVREDYGEQADEALVKARDKARASYYNHCTTGRWGESRNYDLSINSRMGIDKAVRLALVLADRGNGR